MTLNYKSARGRHVSLAGPAACIATAGGYHKFYHKFQETQSPIFKIENMTTEVVLSSEI